MVKRRTPLLVMVGFLLSVDVVIAQAGIYSPISSFPRLSRNEKLVYEVEGESIQNISFFSFGDKGYFFIRKWLDSSEWSGLQFSNNQQRAVVISNEKNDLNRHSNFSNMLYYINGERGYYSRIFSVAPNYRLSTDGKYLFYEDYYKNLGTKNKKYFFWYDLVNRIEIKKITWVMKDSDEQPEKVAGFYIRRKTNNIFYIFLTEEEGDNIVAFAEFDANNLVFSEMWSFSIPSGLSDYPKMIGTEWFDDINEQPRKTQFKKK